MELLKAIYKMFCKLAGSRKAFWNMITTFGSWGLILMFILDWVPQHNQWVVFYIYIADQVSTNIYLGLIEFEKIKLEGKIGA